MGKPAAADLKLGLATAPVLFACEKVSENLSSCCSFSLLSVFVVQLKCFKRTSPTSGVAQMIHDQVQVSCQLVSVVLCVTVYDDDDDDGK